MKIIKVKTAKCATHKLAEMILEQVTSNPHSVLGLATGSTPTKAYHELVKESLINHTNYEHIITFNLDEYVGLPQTDRNSYRYFMNKNLFDYINIKQENTYLPNVSSVTDNYQEYDELIASKGGIDLQILGIGENGHIGFNEPGTSFTTVTHKVTLAQNTIENNARFFESIDEVPKEAVTMGIASILNAKKIILAATGKNKAKIIKELINGDITENVPASALKNHDNVTIILDEEAGIHIEVENNE